MILHHTLVFPALRLAQGRLPVCGRKAGPHLMRRLHGTTITSRARSGPEIGSRRRGKDEGGAVGDIAPHAPSSCLRVNPHFPASPSRRAPQVSRPCHIPTNSPSRKLHQTIVKTARQRNIALLPAASTSKTELRGIHAQVNCLAARLDGVPFCTGVCAGCSACCR